MCPVLAQDSWDQSWIHPPQHPQRVGTLSWGLSDQKFPTLFQRSWWLPAQSWSPLHGMSGHWWRGWRFFLCSGTSWSLICDIVLVKTNHVLIRESVTHPSLGQFARFMLEKEVQSSPVKSVLGNPPQLESSVTNASWMACHCQYSTIATYPVKDNHTLTSGSKYY